MKIAVASGKGGTGKTTVAVSLALSVPDAQLVDADAEEPNCHLFLRPSIQRTIPVYMMVPHVDLTKCDFCRKCAHFCAFNALAVVKEQVLVFPELCHGCTGCVYVCPREAIVARQRQIGEVEVGAARGMVFIQGRLKPTEPSAVRIVREEIAQLDSNGAPAIIDASPGTACAVQDTIGQSQFCLLVTEPTPFGLHDLKMAMDVAQELGVPSGVVINRNGARDSIIEDECRKRNIPVLLKIPFDRRVAEAYSRGQPLVDAFPEWRESLRSLYREIERRVMT